MLRSTFGCRADTGTLGMGRVSIADVQAVVDKCFSQPLSWQTSPAGNRYASYQRQLGTEQISITFGIDSQPSGQTYCTIYITAVADGYPMLARRRAIQLKEEACRMVDDVVWSLMQLPGVTPPYEEAFYQNFTASPRQIT